MKIFTSIKNKLIVLFIMIIIFIMGLSWYIMPIYYDTIMEQAFFETIEAHHHPTEVDPIPSDMYTVQRLLIDSNGQVLTRREDIFSLKFFSEDFLVSLTEKVLSQEEEQKRYVIPLKDLKAYVIIEKFQDIYRVNYMYDIYGKDFARRMVMSNMVLLVFLAVIGSMVMFFFSTRLIKRIDKIRGRVKAIADGEWELPVLSEKEDELGDLERSFEHMRVRLIANDQTKNELFQNISHELKTPIMVISTYAQGVQDNVYPEGDLSKSIEVILDETKKLDEKVQNILLLNKLKIFKDKTEPLGSVKMAPLIEALIRRFQSIGNIHFETKLDHEVVFGGEAEKWTVAIENILSNNLRYAKSVIRISLEDQRLVVFNDGSKIEFDNPDDVFLAYKKGKAGHNGIGLEITKSIVELFGYVIHAENSEMGVSFEIYKKS